VLLQVAGFMEACDFSIAFRANLHDAPGNYRSGMVMQGASSEVLMRVNSIVGGGADAHKEGEAQIEQDGGGGAPHIMKLKVC